MMNNQFPNTKHIMFNHIKIRDMKIKWLLHKKDLIKLLIFDKLFHKCSQNRKFWNEVIKSRSFG